MAGRRWSGGEGRRAGSARTGRARGGLRRRRVDGVGGIGGGCFGAGGVAGVGELSGVEVGLGDRVGAGAGDGSVVASAATGMAGEHENPSRSGVSETLTLCKVTLPVLVAVNV